MIGLFKAIQNFNQEKQNTFKSFANICIERQLITAIKSSNRQKHMPLNSYLSLNTAAYDNNEEDSVELIDTFDSKTIEDPLETVMKKEYYQEKTIYIQTIQNLRAEVAKVKREINSIYNPFPQLHHLYVESIKCADKAYLAKKKYLI